MRDVSDIRGYHAHVYSDPATRAIAAMLREEIPRRFTVELGRWHDGAYGPHPVSSYQVGFATDQLGSILPWLMLHRGELSILVHPRTGDEIADHTAHAVWLGAQLPIDLARL